MAVANPAQLFVGLTLSPMPQRTKISLSHRIPSLLHQLKFTNMVRLLLHRKLIPSLDLPLFTRRCRRLGNVVASLGLNTRCRTNSNPR